jgi:hypothetical protein
VHELVVFERINYTSDCKAYGKECILEVQHNGRRASQLKDR